ncbi:hypothetical protein ACFX1R_026861 [Malus domestica]
MEVEKAAKFVAWVDKEVLCPKYNGSALNDRINKIIRKTRRETLINVITPSYDVKFLQPVIFSTSQVKSDESQDVLLAYVYWHIRITILSPSLLFRAQTIKWHPESI